MKANTQYFSLAYIVLPPSILDWLDLVNVDKEITDSSKEKLLKSAKRLVSERHTRNRRHLIQYRKNEVNVFHFSAADDTDDTDLFGCAAK